MLLSKILKRKDLIDYSINSLEYNSKCVNKNSIFFAIKGSIKNGNDYIDDCILKGCRTFITNDVIAFEKYHKFKGINIFYYKNINKIMAIISKRFYKDISRKLYIIGITGTNGKTTTSTLIYKYLLSIKEKASLIGTNGVYINNEYFEEENTTPNILRIYKYLDLSYKYDIKYVIMEVSSHAISLDRVLGIKFKIKCLTNISLDHLDFHKNFENYKKTKEKWLKIDNFTQKIARNCLFEKINFESWVNVKKNGFKKENWETFCVKSIEKSINGTKFEIFSNKYGSFGIYNTNLISKFNMENICLFLSVVFSINKLNIYYLKEFFNQYIVIDGRLNIIKDKDRTFVIDFAHTPDGILKVLKLFSEYNNDIISVCGCGGNRDKSKREIIGNILSNYSKYSVFTSDNPRDENPLDIINDMMKDVNDNVFVEVDREKAIRKAYYMSNKGDFILLLGKGNEKKQILSDRIIEISDFQILSDLLGDINE